MKYPNDRMKSLSPTWESYVPRHTVMRLAAQPTRAMHPTVERFSTAVLYADVAGFTALTELLARRGRVGIEDLSGILNQSFGRLINVVLAHGGDVVKFAGDAVVAVWPTTADLDLAATTMLAAQCGLALQHCFAADTSATHLTLRMQIGAGDVQMLYVGGVQGRWESMIIGDALLQTNLLVPQTQAGEVVVSPEAWALVAARAVGTPLRAEAVRLQSIAMPQPLPLALPLPLSPDLEAALRAYVPRAMVARIAAGHNDWLAELRRVSVVFVNLPDLSYNTDLAQAHTIIAALQHSIYRYEGSIDKLSVDDKGVSLLAALGLPPLAHEDDAVRAVHAALDIQTMLRELHINSAIGIASGAVFCGEIGSVQRREYTMIGDVVNVAARLMEHAHNDVLCDEQTMIATRNRLHWTTLPPLSLKGKDAAVAVFRPDTSPLAPVQSSRTLVGRSAELATLSAAMERAKHGLGGVYIVEGEAGIGKTAVLATCIEQGRALGLRVLQGAGLAIEQGSPYRGWRSIVSDLLYLHALPAQEPLRSRVLNVRLDLPPELAPYASLLNVVTPLDLPPNERTTHLNNTERAEYVRKLLLHLLTEAAKFPTMLVLEDAHWLDSASWALLDSLRMHLPALLLVVGSRPLAQTAHAYHRWSQHPDVTVLRLHNLSASEIEALITQRLGVQTLPPQVAALIYAKAEGHPFWSEEIAYALRDAGLMRIEAGECLLEVNVGDWPTMTFPDTIQGVITSRIDRLTLQQQLTLKVASVIGRVFAFHALHEVYPIGADKPHLLDYLGGLEQLDITPLEAPEPNLSYIFKHAITQDVAYNLMLYAQRRQLHRAVAEWYERVHAADLAPFVTVLAHHWSHVLDANDPDSTVLAKALLYLDAASENALRVCAYREAATLTERALHLLGAQLFDERIVRLHLRCGEAWWRLGEWDSSLTHLNASLDGARLHGDAHTEAEVLRKIGNVAYVQGDLVTAQRFFETSLAVARASDNAIGIAQAVSNVGVVAWARGDYLTAQAMYQESFTLCLENNNQLGVAVSLINLGQVATALGRFEAASNVLHDALALGQEHQWPLVMLNVLLSVADLWRVTDRPQDGLRLLGLVQSHAASDSEIEAQVAKLLPPFATVLPPEAITAALQPDSVADLNEVVAALLAQLGNAMGHDAGAITTNIMSLRG